MQIIYTKTISNFNLRQLPEFATVNSVCSCGESISILHPKIWELMPSKIKEKESFEAFKFAIEIGCLKIVRVGCAKSTWVRLNLFKDLYLLRRYRS